MPDPGPNSSTAGLRVVTEEGLRFPALAGALATICYFKTTLIYADYAPSGHEVGLVERAFSQELGPDWARAPAEAERPTDPH